MSKLTDSLIQKARTSLLHFIVYMMPEYEVAEHHKLICSKAMELVNGKNKRLIVSLPPRHGKSTILSEFLPAFIFGYFAAVKKEIIATSYGASLAVSFGKKVRRLIESPEYKLLFPDVQILGNSDAGGYFEFTNKSQYVAVGRGGGITGRGADFCLVDDLLKDSQEASSAVIRESCKEWWDSTAYTRLLPGGNVLIVMTRWHEEDLPGYLLANDAKGEWELINIPAICEEPETDFLQRKKGEALWPNWYPISYLEPIKARNAYQFSALYQGNPVAKQGNLCEAQWLNFYNKLPDTWDSIVCSWDTASAAKDISCFNAGIVFGIKGDLAYVLDYVHGRFKFPELLDTLSAQLLKWQPNFALIEDASSGTQLLQMLDGKTGQCKLVPISKQSNKLQKFAGILPIIRGGKLMLAEEGQETLAQELIGYPYGRYDDCVIAITHFLDWWYAITGRFAYVLKSNRASKLMQEQNTELIFGRRKSLGTEKPAINPFTKGCKRKPIGYYTK